MIMIRPSHLLQSFYILAAITIYSVHAIPPLRQRFIAYGSRSADVAIDEKDRVKPSDSAQNDEVKIQGYGQRALNAIAAIQVPHTFFNHFYILSVILSIFWLCQALIGARLINSICRYEVHDPVNESTGMAIGQVALTWTLMTLQGLRRLYESRVIFKPSSTSTMWIGHWFMGLFFYACMSITIWIEGADSIIQLSTTPLSTIFTLQSLSVKTLLGMPIYLLASGIQHDCHTYLASLPKYTIPNTHPAFASLVCPHYTAECAIYLSLAVISAPEQAWVNKTVVAALVFVVVNLGVTAQGTQAWYAKKFGRETVMHKWRMIPGVW